MAFFDYKINDYTDFYITIKIKNPCFLGMGVTNNTKTYTRLKTNAFPLAS